VNAYGFSVQDYPLSALDSEPQNIEGWFRAEVYFLNKLADVQAGSGSEP